jgi:hypothetical protein
MTRAEKRYFKLYVSRHALSAEHNHSVLFDAIAAMDVYDEKALHVRFADKAFMRRFSITKRRLYEALLNSLDAFHAESSVDAKLQRSLHHVEILNQRALHADAARVLRSIRLLAREHDRQPVLLQVAEWERRLMERSNYADISHLDLKARAREVAGLMEEWQEVDGLWQIKSLSFLSIYRNGQVAQGTDKARLEALLMDPLLATDAPLRTTKAVFLRHHVRAAIAYAGNDMPECERQLEAISSLLQEGHGQFREEPDLLLGVIGNLAHVRMRLGRHQEALQGFREFRRLPLLMAKAPSPDLEMKMFILGTSLEFSVLAARGAFAEGFSRLQEVTDGMNRMAGRMSLLRRAELFLQAAYLCFGAEKYDHALHWCNRVLNEKRIEGHVEVHALTRMLHLITLLELGKKDLLPYVLRNTGRSIRSQDRRLGMEKELLVFIRSWLRKRSQAERMACFHRLAHRLEELSLRPSEAAFLDQIDLLSWCVAKVTGRSLAEVVNQNWQEGRPRKWTEAHGPSKAA